MAKIRVDCFCLSLDGYGAGPGQDVDNPIGQGGRSLHEWFAATRTFRRIHGAGDDGTEGVDDAFARRSFENVGAWIIGRNMFGPVRGVWRDDSWKGWWGPNPPFHAPVFVLTHHARESFTLDGGTTFHFVTDGIEAALARAGEAAQGQDIRIGGGVATLKQYLRARLIDEMHLALAPHLLGRGENLFAGLDMAALGYRVAQQVASPNATHVLVRRD